MPSIPYCYSEAGCKYSSREEDNDCVIRALSVCTDKTYDQAAQFLSKHKKQKNQGMFNEEIFRALKAHGGFKRIRFDGTINSFFSKKYNSNKNYLVGVFMHVFPIKKGRVYDMFAPGPRQKVDFVFEYLGKKRASRARRTKKIIKITS